jgi:hypothetical protein
MIIEIEIPDSLPEGHGSSFKKGVAEVLLANATTPLDHTPNGHERSREPKGSGLYFCTLTLIV